MSKIAMVISFGLLTPLISIWKLSLNGFGKTVTFRFAEFSSVAKNEQSTAEPGKLLSIQLSLSLIHVLK